MASEIIYWDAKLSQSRWTSICWILVGSFFLIRDAFSWGLVSVFKGGILRPGANLAQPGFVPLPSPDLFSKGELCLAHLDPARGDRRRVPDKLP